MSKRTVAVLLLLVLGTVLLLAVAPAWARFGGGLGGESFSGGESFGGGGGFGGGSSFGGFGGMGGFGFFPLFLGGGSGSLGTVITIIMVILLLNWVRNAAFRSGGYRRTPRRGSGSFGEQDREAPVELEPTNLSRERAFAQAIDYTRKNMDYFGSRFPYWDRDMLVGRVKQAFFVLQDAWSRQDLSGGRDYLTADLYREYEEKLARMRERGERDVIRDVGLRDSDVNFVYSRMDEEGQSFIVMIFASMYDYVVNPAGEVVSGNRDKKLYFREFWEFVWQDELWKLARIHEEDSVTIARIKNMDLS